MRMIYLDSEYRCHVADDGGMTAVSTDFFDGKCDSFIEGYRCILEGETWTRSDGVTFRGPMIAPWKDYRILQAYQEQYEAMAINEEIINKAAAYDVIMEGVGTE